MLDFYGTLAEKLGVDRLTAKETWMKLQHSGILTHPEVVATPHNKVAAFHRKYGLAYEGKPRELPGDILAFRIGFMLEEIAEYCHACGLDMLGYDLEEIIGKLKDPEELINRRTGKEDLHGQLDALLDLAYVLHGTAYLQGFDFDRAFDVVHQANMKKVRAERKEDSKRGSTYDVVKPVGWTPPKLDEFLS